ncbi:putative U box domain, Zinc finger, RING/FYVE/PHD-type [Helianthus anomalus]
MASEEIALVLSHCSDNHHLLFNHEATLGFHRNPPHQPPPQNHRPNHHTATHSSGNNNNNDKTTRELTGFIEHQNRHYEHHAGAEFRRSFPESAPPYHRGVHEWEVRSGRSSSSPSGDGSESDDEDVDDMDDDVSGEKNGDVKMRHGSVREVMKEGSVSMSGNDMNDVRSSSVENHQQGQICQYQNAITVADPNGELYYSQLFNGVEGSGAGFKDMLVENGCGFSGRKSGSYSGGSGESLRTILSDPLTGALMDDAMILPCGHSFGSSGMQHVMRVKACYTCSQPVSESSVAPNLSLRSAVHAFLREEELQRNRATKRRNKLDLDRSNYGDVSYAEQSRGRGVQFPFCVSERVIIKGNKRTPPRFVGREAIVTTQCLNGWYVVKTLDNAESVKLQYRSLAKIRDSQPSTVAPAKIVTPNWL